MRQIRYWLKEGLLEASLSTYKGRGGKLLFNLQDLLIVLVILELKKRGLSTKRITQTVKRARERWDVTLPLAELKTACLAQSLVFKKDGCYIEGLSGQQVFEITLERVERGLGKKARKESNNIISQAERNLKKLVEAA